MVLARRERDLHPLQTDRQTDRPTKDHKEWEARYHTRKDSAGSACLDEAVNSSLGIGAGTRRLRQIKRQTLKACTKVALR